MLNKCCFENLQLPGWLFYDHSIKNYHKFMQDLVVKLISPLFSRGEIKWVQLGFYGCFLSFNVSSLGCFGC